MFLVGVRFGVGVCGFWLVPDLLVAVRGTPKSSAAPQSSAAFPALPSPRSDPPSLRSDPLKSVVFAMG